MKNHGRKLENAEIALCELYDSLHEKGETTRANDIARVSRRISSWRNE